MSDNLTTRELYAKKQKEYQDAQVEQRVYANKLAEATKAFEESLASVKDAISGLPDEEFAARFSTFLAGLDMTDLDVNRLEGYIITLQSFYDELDKKAREALNG